MRAPSRHRLHLHPAMLALVLGAIALAAVACGGDDEPQSAPDGGSGGSEEQSGGGGTLTLGGVAFSDHGTSDARGEQALTIEAGSFYFEPTFIRGEPGESLTLRVRNDSGARHNVSYEPDRLDEDVPAGETVEVTLTVPESGVAVFVCKFHTGQGMRGELLAGDAEPAAPPRTSAGAGTSSDSESDYYGY